MFKRWSFTSNPEGRAGGNPLWGRVEYDDEYPYEYYGWDDPKTKLLRRFDMLKIGTLSMMSFDDENQPQDEFIVDGRSLAHEHFGTFYDHDQYHSGSQQDLLAKSKWSEARFGLPQMVMSNFDIFKVEHNYFRNPRNLNNPRAESVKRELSDWLSPGWFALAEGGTLAASINELAKIVWLSNSSDLEKFRHRCYEDTSQICEGVSDTTYIMILPADFDSSYVFELDSCYNNPQYEIMRVELDTVAYSGSWVGLKVTRAWRGKRYSYAGGSQVRPLVWTNPNNWGNIAFVMNVSTMAPGALLRGEPFHWYDVGALYVADHHLKSLFHIIDTPENDTVSSFYAADGIWLDAYNGTPCGQLVNNPKMFFHSENIDLNVDGESDELDVDCDSVIESLWKEGYSAFLKQVRDFTKGVRGDSTDLFIITNGHPDTSHYKYLNGRHFEDTNGGFQESGWAKVVARTRVYNSDERFVEPRMVAYFERERDLLEKGETNLMMMRLTLGVSLLFTDNGFYGTTGQANSRSPVFDTTYVIEDYQDEYAVDDSCYGAWNSHFPKEILEPGLPVFDEEHLFDSIYHLGAPLDTVKTYTAHHFERNDTTYHDIFYREFDHGLAVAHFGTCALMRWPIEGESIPYQWVSVGIDSMDLLYEDDPRAKGYHFMGIDGCNWSGYTNMFNDSTNVRQHPVEVFQLHLYGDGLVLLKEGDGFAPEHPPDSE
jgi:hypothetical protein